MMQMMANPSSFAFATSEPPQGVVMTGNSCKSPESCSCKVQDFECGCGVRLGYYLLSPCEECQDAKTVRKWFLCPRSVEAEPHEAENVVTSQEKPASPQFGCNMLAYACCAVRV